MRILEVSPYDLGVAGGVQAQVIGLARAFRSEGAEVQIAAPGTSVGTTISLGASSQWPANGSIAPVAILARTRLLKGALEWADVVHVHEPLTPMAGIAVLRTIRRLDLSERLWVTFHRDGVSESYRRWASWWSYLLPQSKHWVAVSPFAVRTVVALCNVVPTEIPNGVGSISAALASGIRDSDRPRILFVGRHEGRKGLEVLLRAFERLDADVELVIVGAGPLTTSLQRRYVDSRIRWLGTIGSEELAANYQRADVVVAPSLGGESFGVVLLEAMVGGAVVVASDLPAYRWLSEDGYAAALFPPGDAQALARLLESLLGDEQARRTFIERGYARAEEFGFPMVARQYLALFSQE